MPRWLERELQATLPGLTRRVVEVQGPHGPHATQSMHVMERGSGVPVVMLHGNPTWSYLWRKVAARLDPTRYRVVMPDLVGLGFSSRPAASAHTLEDHIAWFGDLLDRLEDELGRFVFVGQDWGGPVGFGALLSRRERVSGLVVLNTAIGPPRQGFKPNLFHRFARWPVVSDLVFRVGQFPQAFMAVAQGDRRMEPRAVRGYVTPLLDPRDNHAPLMLARMVPDGHEHPSIPALEQSQRFVQTFDGPSAIVWGQRDPVLGRMLSWVEKNLPRAEVTRTQAGHFLQEEVPDQIAAAIERVAAKGQGAGDA
ncbi:MAG TPA: alpha/beta fold hydrolase [Myxococcota bacterium]|nr:alpha/beta fold hydrolase [Myxococcota bacterium]